ncbi:glycine cleavage system aminomethyltransferase GcvT [Pseudomonas aeruginosa]
MTAETLAKTPLHALHLELGAKMVPFAGYDMPVQYPAGVLKEHLHTREQAGLFDVSHMGQIRLVGADAALALESLVPVDILDLPVGQQRYALFTDEQGGILDDLMVANLGDCLLLVVNAACKHQDLAHLRRHLEDRCSVEPLFEERALLALQGPAAVRVLERLAPQVAQMTFMQFARVELLGQDCYVSRSGYTGEDGYEISVPAAHALELAVGAAETVLGAKACRWVRLLSAQAEAKQAAVFQAADPLPVASAVRCGNRAGRVQGLLRGRVEAFQLAQEEVEVAAATLVVAGAFEHRHECRAAVTLQQFQQGSGGSRIGLPERLGHRFAPTARVTADEGARRHFVAFQQRIDLLGQFRRVAVDAQGDPQASWSGAFEQVFQGHAEEVPL